MEWMILPLKRYADFSGRSRRMEYWMFALGVFLLYMLLMAIVMVIGFGAIGAASTGSPSAAMGGMMGLFASMGILAVVFGVVWLGLLIPSIAVAVRRLHDTDRSGWWLMLYVVPYVGSVPLRISAMSSGSGALAAIAGLMSLVGFVGAIALLVFFCLPGTPGLNRFGPDPINGMAGLAETFR